MQIINNFISDFKKFKLLSLNYTGAQSFADMEKIINSLSDEYDKYLQLKKLPLEYQINIIKSFENIEIILKSLEYVNVYDVFDVILQCKNDYIINNVLSKYIKYDIKIMSPHNDIACSICLNFLDTIFVQTNCKHDFHFNCLYKWIANNHSCPCCRAEIKNTNNSAASDINSEINSEPDSDIYSDYSIYGTDNDSDTN